MEELVLRAALIRLLKEQPKVSLEDQLFDKQKAFFNSPRKRKMAVCSRRAGKSELAARLLARACNAHPGSIALYIALTRDSCRRIIWPVLYKMNEDYKLGWKLNDSNLTITTPNGSMVWLVGADMSNLMHRLRGAKYSICIVDEIQSMRSHVSELIDDVIDPALMDLQGELCAFGTPGPLPSGYFYDSTERGMNGFEVFKWTLMDNPFLPHARDYVERLIKDKGWTQDNPTLQREWYGQWVLDLDALLFRFARDRNLYDAHPEFPLTYILGIDYGFNDKTAFVVLGYNSSKANKIWVVHTEAASEMIPSEIAIKVKELNAKYRPVRIVADTGGLGKSITEEMIRRYGIPIKAADKAQKAANIHLMNGDFIDSKILIHRSLGPLIDELETVQKGENGIEDGRAAADCVDAALYAWRECYAYGFKPEVHKPTEEDKTLKRLLERDQTPWWEGI